MELSQLNLSVIIAKEDKVYRKVEKLQNLLSELRTRELTDEVINIINEEIAHINAAASVKELSRAITKRQHKILTTLERKLKLVAKNHYRNTWMAIGMSAFGVSLGTAFGAAMDNMGLLAIGIPIGMCIGIAVGSAMDADAQKKGNQLNFSS